MKVAALLPLAAAALALAGCGMFGHHRDRGHPPPPSRLADAPPPMPAMPAAPGWHETVTPADRERLRNWRTSWTQAIAKAEASGQGPRIRAQGALLQPDAALADPAPPPGDYRCRVIKLGAQTPGGLDYVAYPAFGCRIVRDGEVLRFVKLEGSQRPIGLLYPDDVSRMVFLGTMLLGDEARPMAYGRDPDRDMVGALQRIGPARWRLVIPAPRWESLLDVIELVPVG